MVEVVLRKGEKGLGFSILDYQVTLGQADRVRHRFLHLLFPEPKEYMENVSSQPLQSLVHTYSWEKLDTLEQSLKIYKKGSWGKTVMCTP